MQLYFSSLSQERTDTYVELGELESVDLVSFAYQITSGMVIVSGIKIVSPY